MALRFLPWVVSLVTFLGLARLSHAAPEIHLIEARNYVGLHAAGYSTVDGDTSVILVHRGSIGASLSDLLRFRIDGLFAGVPSSGTLIGSVAGRAYLRGSRFAGGLSFGHTWASGAAQSETLALHFETREASWLTVSASVGYERKAYGDSLLFAELMLRLYLAERWLIQSGVSYAAAEIKQTRADVILRVECTLFRWRWFSPAIFAQYGGNLLTRVSGGLTFYFDALGYRKRELRDSLFAARFD